MLAAILAALQAAPNIVSIVEAGIAALKIDFGSADQTQVDAAIAAAKAKLDTDVARVESEA